MARKVTLVLRLLDGRTHCIHRLVSLIDATGKGLHRLVESHCVFNLLLLVAADELLLLLVGETIVDLLVLAMHITAHPATIALHLNIITHLKRRRLFNVQLLLLLRRGCLEHIHVRLLRITIVLIWSCEEPASHLLSIFWYV